MVRIELLCISSFQPNRSSYSKSQTGEVSGDHDYTMVDDSVLVSHYGIIIEKFPYTFSSKCSDFTIQNISKTPTLSENEIHLSGKASETQTFQEKLQMLSQIRGEQPHKSI